MEKIEELTEVFLKIAYFGVGKPTSIAKWNVSSSTRIAELA